MPLLVISSRALGWMTTRSPSGRSVFAIGVAAAGVVDFEPWTAWLRWRWPTDGSSWVGPHGAPSRWHHRLCETVARIWYLLDYVNRNDHRDSRSPDLHVVPGAGADRARGPIDALRAQTPRCGDHRPLLVVPPRPPLQGAAAPRRARPADRGARGGWTAAAAVHDHRPRPRGDPGVARERRRRNRPSCAMPVCSSCSSRIWGQPTTAGPLRVAQLAIHRAALARYEDDRHAEGVLNGSDAAARTVEHWRGVTLPMGLLYERAAVEFWEGVAAPARVDGATADRSRAEDDGARLASNEN